MPTLTTEEDISELLQDINNYHGTIIVKTTLSISAYVFVRPSELANSKWEYINRMVSHGFRGMASTILNENKFRDDIIEKQLAHQERNSVRDAYNHAEYLEERIWRQKYKTYLASR